MDGGVTIKTFLRDYYKKSPDAFFVLLSISFFWCWLHIFIFNFDTSPLSGLVYKTGADGEVAQLIFCVVAAIGVCIQLFLFDEEKSRKSTPYFLLAWIVCSVIPAFVTNLKLYYTMIALMSLFAGFILCRVMLLLIFTLPKKDAARYIIVQFTITNIPFMILRAQLFGTNVWLNYAIIVAIQIACAVFLLKAKPQILKIRSDIPSKVISLKEILLVTAIVGGIYFCMGGIKNIARPSFDDTPYVYLFQIIPNVLTIVVIYFWLYRMKLAAHLTAFLLLLGVSLTVFQISNGTVTGRYVFEFFMEAANYFIDVFEFVLFARLIYAYGRRGKNIKIMISIVTLIIGVFYGVSALFWTQTANLSFYGLFYLVTMALIIAMPYLTRSLGFLFDERFADKPPIMLKPAQNYDNLTQDELRKAIPNTALLTEREAEVLLLICRRQDNDVIAELLSISKSTLNKHISSIYQKLELKNRRDLFALCDSAGSCEEKHIPLTLRETEVLELLLCGKNEDEISSELSISTKTTRTHINNICKKHGAKTKAELLQSSPQG